MQKRIPERADPILITEAVIVLCYTVSSNCLSYTSRVMDSCSALIIINEAVYIAVYLMYSASTLCGYPIFFFFFVHESKIILFDIKASGVR